MARNIRIIIADRSALAENLYRLLFAGHGVDISVKKRFEEARPHFFKRDAPDTAIINTNCLGKKALHIISEIAGTPEIARIKKIFLIKENSDHMVAEALKSISNTIIAQRPFHPDDFLELVLSTSDKTQ